jgi:TonB-dependent SusC/RagA subfamily outer membrane receptor
MKQIMVFILLFSVAVGNAFPGQKSKKSFVITGYVVDKTQYPVVKAVILIDNKVTKIVTDQKGFYKVRVKSTDKNIGISVLVPGLDETPLISQQSIDGTKRINFTLDVTIPRQLYNQNISSNEEVVNIGYGNVKKKDLASFVGQIDGREERNASYISIYDMLTEVPGVVVRGKNVQIHGIGSVYSGTEPLYIVDGTYVDSIDNISPLSVRSVEVLKGSSAAIYGTRGANGVILINLNHIK